jgi:hypothetical protein
LQNKWEAFKKRSNFMKPPSPFASPNVCSPYRKLWSELRFSARANLSASEVATPTGIGFPSQAFYALFLDQQKVINLGVMGNFAGSVSIGSQLGTGEIITLVAEIQPLTRGALIGFTYWLPHHRY